MRLEKDSNVTVLKTLMGFFIYREADIKEMLQNQDTLNKGVKRGLIHLFQITHNFMLFTVPAFHVRWSLLSVGGSGAHAQFQHIHIQDQLK